MGRPYSVDLRERMVAAHDAGMSCRGVAGRFAVSVSCVIKLVQHKNRSGGVEPRRPSRRKPYALANHEALVRGFVAGQPDLTLDELQAALAADGVSVGRTSVHRYLKSLNLTLKKSR